MNTEYKTTFVTALFDCHDDVSNDDFNKNYYIARAVRVLMINQPMIIFCNSKYTEIFAQIRNIFGYGDKTKVITTSLDSFRAATYKTELANVYKHSPENKKITPNLYVLWMSKFEIMHRAIMDNTFNTTHFAWIDINLLMKVNNGSMNYLDDDVYDKIDRIAANPRDLWTSQVINYWDPSYYADLGSFFKQYRWIVAGGFYTCDLNTGMYLLPKFMDKAEEICRAGFCQGDEALYAFIIDENLDHFNLYIGDYQDIINNYHSLTSNHHYVQRVLSTYQQHNMRKYIKLTSYYK
jgi:hypothetical protein